MNKLLIILTLLALSLSAHARMYQWIDPDTNTTQLSGKPPYWYRSGEPGPRVIVFDNGKVIDDTGVNVSDIENVRLRQQALIIVEQDRLSAIEKLRQAELQKAAFGVDEEEDEPMEIILDPVMEESTVDEGRQAEADDSEIEQQMRELLEQYEALKTESAKDVIESSNQ
ncbi:MAG: hypothetical protein HKN08_07315 [Gammaproteobacteria bacterium]|nr:hypothetical protein [Gammaproteobacteria bacterium]